MIYNFGFSDHTPINQLIGSFTHGLKMDVSVVSYFLFFNFISAALFLYFKPVLWTKTNRILNKLLIVIFTTLVFVDAELYHNWGFRIDNTILLYIKTPAESIASTPLWLFILFLLSTTVVSVLCIRFYSKFIDKRTNDPGFSNLIHIPVYFILAGLMIIPIRGGLGVSTMNQGMVYFSKEPFANHAAINCFWNFGKSLLNTKKLQELHFMPEQTAIQTIDSLYQPNSAEGHVQLVRNKKPNILIIILESFTAKAISSLGDIEGATPNLDLIASESVLFKNFYASGDRSDKGIVAILSGYPAQPTSSIIKFPNKTAKLPHLSKILKKQGYHSAFYYGGEINFANMNAYFTNGEYDRIISSVDFPKEALTGKWGAHDQWFFNRLFTDIDSCQQPFFKVMFSLSSHEPFEVPHQSRFDENTEDSRFLNSVNYTDSCLGDFIRKAKKSSWWDNTWIIMLADHGSRLPGNTPYQLPEKFHIPMIWTGGAIPGDTSFNAICSQHDLPAMIMNQLNLDSSPFYWSKDILSGGKHFAFYNFNNGFCFFTDSSGFVLDNVNEEIILDSLSNQKDRTNGSALMQILLSDFNRL